jgi:hypothetical protein
LALLLRFYICRLRQFLDFQEVNEPERRENKGKTAKSCKEFEEGEMANQFDTRTDTVVLIFSTLAVLIAATLSMATISNNHDDTIAIDSPDAAKRAEAAANAGIESAKWHIECHGRTEAGGLMPKYYINGAIYTVEWDDVNMADSTVTVRSLGEFSWGDNECSEVMVESTINLEFFPKHNQEILSDYYNRALIKSL